MNLAAGAWRVALRQAAWRFCAPVLVLVSGGCGPEALDERPPLTEAQAEAAEASGRSWRLEDGSELRVLLYPWPPKPGAPTDVFVEVDQGDWSNRDYPPRVRLRLATSPDGDEPWYAMTPLREDDATLYFRHTTRLASGRRYIQFEVTCQGFSQPNVLRDWSIDVP